MLQHEEMKLFKVWWYNSLRHSKDNSNVDSEIMLSFLILSKLNNLNLAQVV